MEIVRGKTAQALNLPYPVVAIGNFDGVHRGHQTILHETVRRARAQNGTPVVLTFDPHPLKILSPEKELKFLMSFKDRAACFEKEGIQVTRAIPFSPEFAEVEAGEFVERVLRDELGAKEVCVGSGFRFGKDREGNVAFLHRWGELNDVLVFPVPLFNINGKRVSSSRIREYLHSGDVKTAAEFLGRPYSLQGEVIASTGRGTPMGYPTANFNPPPEQVIPANGIYAVRATLGDREDRLFDGVSYIGTQPTLGAVGRMIETHLFEPQPDLYGETLRVRFLQWIRAEKVFESPQELRKRIQEDVEKARAYLAFH